MPAAIAVSTSDGSGGSRAGAVGLTRHATVASSRLSRLALKKDELLRAVWPDTFVEENNLAQNISMLRRALGTNAEGGAYIETVPKRGYRFVGTVTQQIAAASGPSEPAPAAALASEPPVASNPPLVADGRRQ